MDLIQDLNGETHMIFSKENAALSDCISLSYGLFLLFFRFLAVVHVFLYNGYDDYKKE